MKKLIVLFSLVAIAFASNAQNPFKPLPKLNIGYGALSAAKDSILNAFRPVVNVSAVVSDGTQLAGGFGMGFQHLKWDQTSQSWVAMYTVSAIAFIGTTGTKVTGTGGIVVGIPGTNGIVSIGGGRDFTQGKWVIITGAQINFN